MRRKHALPLQHKQFAFKADAVNDDGTFSGYGSVFGNVDSYREIVAPGAFKESLKAIKAAGDPLPALWQHDQAQPIGGYTSLQEDEHGLKVEGFLMLDEVAKAREAFALMKRRVVKGLSIGYYVLSDSYDEKERIRTLTKLDLVEVSVVTFPANPEAQVDAVKAAIAAGKLPSMKEFERFLREAGFSKTEAAAIASGGLSKLLRSESGDAKANDLVRQALANLTR